MSVRTEIADAVSAVADVTCHPYYVQGTAPGTAWVRLDRIEYPNPFGGIGHFNVVVVLPQDMAQAERWLESHQAALIEAVSPYLVVTSVTPQRLDTTAGVLPVAFLNGHREID